MKNVGKSGTKSSVEFSRDPRVSPERLTKIGERAGPYDFKTKERDRSNSNERESRTSTDFLQNGVKGRTQSTVNFDLGERYKSTYEFQDRLKRDDVIKRNNKSTDNGARKNSVFEQVLEKQKRDVIKDTKTTKNPLKAQQESPRIGRRNSNSNASPSQQRKSRDSLDTSAPPLKTRPGSGLDKNVALGGEKKKTTQPRKRKQPVTANMSGTRYEIVRQCVEKAGFVLTRDDDMNSFLTWVDSYASTDRIAELKSHQRINHFPNMGEICRKDALCRNMMKMAKERPEEYNFTPKTWTLPSEYNTFLLYSRELKKKKKVKTFIAKPANGAMGNGISLFRNADKIPSAEHYIVQEYLDKPFLIDGYKCDLRIYVLMTACDPLRLFLFHDGLLRLGTEKYLMPTESNIDQLYMHLTNYSINKHSDNYEKVESPSSGSKRSLKFLNDYLRKNDHDVAFLWRNIVDIIVKTLIVAQPHVLHAYRMCRPGQPPGSDSVSFEVLGFDIMLDRKLKPWLLEVNRSPSFGTDEKIDYQIKSSLLNDTFRLLNIRASDRRKNIVAQKADAQKRLFRPVKRPENDSSDSAKRRIQVERRKEELKELLVRVRRDASREDFENRNCGRFQRIFPPEDKFRQEKYAGLMSAAFSLFLSSRSGTLQREIELTYNNKLQEVDILDMLAQYETDEKSLPARQAAGRKASVSARKPLQSLPSSQSGDSRPDDDMSTDDDYWSQRSSRSKSRSYSLANNKQQKQPFGGGLENQDKQGISPRRSKSLPRNSNDISLGALLPLTPQERENELTKKTLIALNDMRIRFPGKTNEEADLILDKIHESWKHHKPRVASYWLVKLDSVKRRKVIDIVRSNVRSVIQRTWHLTDIDQLKLTRIFTRVFNRLQWSHGQGLWNCFTTSGTSWETIFSKSSDVITTLELNCCRRIVQLCKDCLLIVYQFALDAKAGVQYSNNDDTPPRTTLEKRKLKAEKMES